MRSHLPSEDVAGDNGTENEGEARETSEDEALSPELVELDYTPEELQEIYESTDTEVLQLALNETRPTLDAIQEFLSDIDDKAGRTLRLNTVILGIILTIVSLSSSNPGANIARFVNLGFYAGSFASGTSFIASFITYTRSSITPGITVGDVEGVLEEPIDRKSLLISLLVAHGQWIRENGKVNRQDAFTLFIGHTSLLLSIGYYSLAVVSAFTSSPWWTEMLGIGILSVVLIAVIYAPQTPYWDTLWAKGRSLKEGLLNLGRNGKG